MQNSSNCPQPPSNELVRLAVRRALGGAVLTGAVAATGMGTAQAQQAAAAATSETQLTEVVVTGSRIAQPALEAVSPVSIVSAAQIQEAGSTRIEDILNQLPQVVGDMGSALANGATGAATVSLRGLGCQRTLVLINSRRLMPGDPTEAGTSCSDLNQIPTDLIQRVDILTGGASAVYGADAVAGVVNFVMNDHFEGFRFDANDGFYNHSQHDGGAVADLNAAGFAVPTGSTTAGQTADFTAILGSNFDDGKGNAVVYLGYPAYRSGAAGVARFLGVLADLLRTEPCLRRIGHDHPDALLVEWRVLLGRPGRLAGAYLVPTRRRPVQLRTAQLLPATR